MANELSLPRNIEEAFEVGKKAGYIEWHGGTDPEKPDVIALSYSQEKSGRKLCVMVGPYRDNEHRTGLELPVTSKNEWAVYRLMQTNEGAKMDAIETERSITEPTLSDTDNTISYRRREYRAGQLDILFSLANNDAVRGRPVELSSPEAMSVLEALRKALTHKYS